LKLKKVRRWSRDSKCNFATRQGGSPTIGVGIRDQYSKSQGGDSKYYASNGWSCVKQGQNPCCL